MKRVRDWLRPGLVLCCLTALLSCGGGNSFQETDEPEFSVEGTAAREVQLPPTEDHSQPQPPVVLRNTGDGVLRVTRLEFVDQPERLVAIGEAGGSCADGCGENEVCQTSSQTCHATGLPEVPFEIPAQQRVDIDLLVPQGAGPLGCAEPGADVPAEFAENYCGALIIETNAINSSNIVTEGKATLYFLDPGLSGEIDVTPQFIEFTGVQAGVASTQQFSVRNSGEDVLTVEQIRVEDRSELFTLASEQVSTPPFDIEPGDSVEFTLTLEPPSDASPEQLDFATNIEITSSALNGKQRIPVRATSGAGSAPVIEITPEILKFDAAAEQTLTIENSGEATLQLTGLTVQPVESRPFYSFEVDGNDVTQNFERINIPKGQSKEIVVKFARPAGNEESSVGILEIAHNDKNAGFKSDVTLLGDEGDVPIGQVVPGSFSFLAADANSESREFVVRNVGTADLVIDQVTWTASTGSQAEFQLSNVQATIPPNGIHRMSASFDGANNTPDVVVATFDSNNGGRPLQLSLRALVASGEAPQPVIEPTFSNDARVGNSVGFTAASSTPEGASERAVWTLLSRPSGSEAWIDEVGETMSFVPDVAGSYTIAVTILHDEREAQVTYDFQVVD